MRVRRKGRGVKNWRVFRREDSPANGNRLAIFTGPGRAVARPNGLSACGEFAGPGNRPGLRPFAATSP
jgi:hypothetical protein